MWGLPVAHIWHGTSGDDTFVGVSINDDFILRQGGHDTAWGGDGDDRYLMGGALDAGDTLDGDADFDSVWLRGDYSSGLTLGATTITNIEVLRLDGAFDYNLTTNDANVGSHARLMIDARRIDSGHHLTFDGSADTDGRFRFLDSAGGDTLTGGHRNDLFDMQRGGGDTVYGGSGEDRFAFGGALDALDGVYGGHGDDTLLVDGDYVTAVTLTMSGIETMILGAGHVYNFVLQDGAVAANKQLEVDGYDLDSVSDGISFDASALTHGEVNITASDGDDVLKGGADSDFFDLASNKRGEDTVSGGGGDDYFVIGSGLDAGDKFDGGAGFDSMQIFGDFSAGVTFAADTITGIESIALVDDFLNAKDYKFITNDGNVAAGAVLGVYGFQIPSGNFLYWDGSAETDGTFDLHGGAGADTLIGGAGDDTIAGGAGNNTMRGGGGADDITCQFDSDTLVYGGGSDSASTNYDTVHSFNADADKIQSGAGYTIEGVNGGGGSLSVATFDTDMASAVDQGVRFHSACVVTATGGDLSGHVFLVIDSNDSDSYTGGADLVIDITGYTGTIDTGDFI